jgi:hypothetical protein
MQPIMSILSINLDYAERMFLAKVGVKVSSLNGNRNGTLFKSLTKFQSTSLPIFVLSRAYKGMAKRADGMT